MVKKFAEELKEARLKEGISLQDIHDKTKVDIKFLESIENGNFEVMPEVYIRAFIKSYASSVGLDVPTVMAKYDAAKSGKIIEEKQEAIPEEIKPEPVAAQEKKPAVFTGDASTASETEAAVKSPQRNSLLILITGVVFVLAIIAYFFIFKTSSNEIITEKPYDSVITENKKRFESENEPTSTVQAAGNLNGVTDSLNLLIRANNTSWFLVKTDGDSAGKDFILFTGSTKILKAARQYNITVGNSGNITFILNDRTLKFSGSNGEVKSITIDSTGIRY